MRSPKSMHWWAWKKKKSQENNKHNENPILKLNVSKLTPDVQNNQLGGAQCKPSFLNRVKYLPTIPMNDYSLVRSRLDDIYILPNGDKPTIESMERKE